jgi:YYY domain-containing protein
MWAVVTSISDRLRQVDWTVWLLVAITLLSLLPRLYGLNWDSNNHLHPDEREIVFRAMCLSLPGGPRPENCDPAYTGAGWFFSPNSPLNPHFFAYGSFPLYLLAAATSFLSWLTHLTGGRFLPTDAGVWNDFNHFTLVGRAISAFFDAGSVLLAGLIARRLAGRWVALLAAAFVAVIPFNIQVAHFYAVDTLLLFFVLLTLLGCVALAQSQPMRGAPVWLLGLGVGASFSLALATKVSALPLLLPIGVALLLLWRRRGVDALCVGVLAISAATVLIFLVVSPYAIIDYANFKRQVDEQTALSQGQLDYPYVRQYADTAPYLYPLRQLLLFNVGLPLGLLGIGGFVWACAQVWRKLESDWAILAIWIAAYFAAVGGAYMKFSRYMLPLFAPLAICGAAALSALAIWGVRRIEGARASDAAEGKPWRRRAPFGSGLARLATQTWGTRWWVFACGALALAIFAATAFNALALTNIYSQPNTRVQASEWIYDHVPAGAVLTNEIWDDPLPIGVPVARTDAGVDLTAGGHVINPGQYSQVGLNLYDEDTADKAATLSQQLASADVIVISSQRLLRSIPKLPDRYPMTTRYYDLLFAGKLGFTLAATFENSPNLAGYRLDDTTADESFSVYDHPPVWIFARSGPPMGADQIKAALTANVSLPGVPTRPGSWKSLLLDQASQSANAGAAPLGVQFPASSLPNRIPLIWWLLVVELLGLIAFPLAFSAFPGLRERGWGLSKLLGLLIVAYAVWLPSSLRLLPFDAWAVALVFLLLAVVSGVVAWRRRAALIAFLRERWRLIAICEVGFLAAFLFFTWIRALDPDLWHIYRGGEKPMELAYLDGILRSRYMPPADPWFSGGYINYYYYGQYLIAVLIKLTGVAPTTAFNLAIPLLFALTFSAAFSVVAGLTGRWWTGLVAGVALVVLGNLEGVWQLVGQWQATLAHQPVPPFDYWRSSRVIPCLGVAPNPNVPCYDTTINEFPYWSFLYADLHAHLIDLPIVVLLVGCCASLLNSARAFAGRWLLVAPTLAVSALALGASWCVNTWDTPTFGLLIAVALTLYWLGAGKGFRLRNLLSLARWERLRGYLAALALTFGGAYLLYWPFHLNFQTFVSGTGPVTTPTAPYQFFTIFGLWLFLLATFFYVELKDRLQPYLEAFGFEEPLRSLFPWALFAIYLALLLLATLVSLKVVLVLLIGLGLVLALDLRQSAAKLLSYAMLLLGLGIALGVEIIYVRDFLDNSPWERMNTVFKFYYQVWILLALGATLAFVWLVRRLWAPLPDELSDDENSSASGFARSRVVPLIGPLNWLARRAWTMTLVLLVFGSTVFLVEGTQVRLQDPAIWAAAQPPAGGVQPQGLSLDGMAYMRGWYPSDYDAINWMNQHVGGMPVVVEATGGVYEWYGRVAIYTGLPDVVEPGHEGEQRYGGQQPFGDQIAPRVRDVEQFWSTSDPDEAVGFLTRYHVGYIYLGKVERECYTKQGDACVPMSGAAIDKFHQLAGSGRIHAVYSNSDVVIFQVTPQ